MQTIIFTCKTVTPLVMNGPYGDFPELRPPGIKASLRFWWRALHGHLSLDQLREQEGRIFGSTKGRSKVLIRVMDSINDDRTEKTSLLPHKGGSEVAGYTTGETFKIRLDFKEDVISIEKIKSLFIIACTLGGWGKRSRRGFGSVVVTEVNGLACTSLTTINDILAHLERIVPSKHRISGNQIESTHVSKYSRDEYPKLWKIEIGNTQRSLRDIGQATHNTKFTDDISQSKQDYSKSLGDGRPRYASPIYVSLLSNGLPVISTLKKQSWVNIELQDKLKEKIL
jgi:CRISPR-associated protein Cmr1